MRKVSAHEEPQLPKAQCDFRPGRGTVAAVHDMGQILCKHPGEGCAAAFAFVDSIKAAYTSVHQPLFINPKPIISSSSGHTVALVSVEAG